MVGRFGLSDISPSSAPRPPGSIPAHGAVGEPIPISAVVFREGHDAVGASVVLRDVRTAEGAADPDGHRAHRAPTAGTPRCVADRLGPVDVRGRGVERPVLDLAPRRHDQDRGRPGRRGPRQRPRGRRPAVRPAGEDRCPKAERPRAVAAARGAARHHPRRRAPGRARARRLPAGARRTPTRSATWSPRSPRYPLWIDRHRALFGSWYEFFPRSIGAELAGDPTAPGPTGPARHVQGLPPSTSTTSPSLGFDVVYLPPIHPIGEVNRKGPNNTLVAASWDVGSPWAIGSRDGGHDAIHPELGHDGRLHRVGEAREGARHGDRARLRAAVRARPPVGRRRTRSGSPPVPTARIAYAENPPKKYQDIYPLNFDNDPKGLYAECLRIVRHWIDAGVNIFRVDNPHTKPINFWQWLIGEVRKTNPDVLFLAEAFTRPAMMAELAKIGFHQSYTYFTWRNTKDEIETYAQQLVELGALHAAELLHQHAGHPERVPRARRAGRVRDPRGARRDALADLRRVLRLRAVRAPEPPSGQRGVPRLGEVPAAAARLRRCDGGRTLARAAAHPAQPDPARAPGAAAAAQPALPPRSTTPTSPRSASATRRPATPSSSSARPTRTSGARRPRRSTCRRSAWSGTPASACVDLLDGAEYHWGQHNYVRLDPHHRPAHIFQVHAALSRPERVRTRDPDRKEP